MKYPPSLKLWRGEVNKDMGNLPTKLSLERKFQGKELSKAFRDAANKSAGRRLDNYGAKKELINTLAYKSEYGRENILKRMGLKYDDRNKLKAIISNQGGLSDNDFKKRQLKMKKYNIAMSVKAADEEYDNLIGKQYTSGASINSGRKFEKLVSSHGASSSASASAIKVAGGFGVKNSAAPGMRRNGAIGSMGMGRL